MVLVSIATKTSASKSIRSQQTVDSHRGPSSTRHSDLQTHGNNNLPLSPEGRNRITQKNPYGARRQLRYAIYRSILYHENPRFRMVQRGSFAHTLSPYFKCLNDNIHKLIRKIIHKYITNALHFRSWKKINNMFIYKAY